MRIRLIIALTAFCLAMPALADAMPWSWDMFFQISHKAQEEKALPTPEGTVPTKGADVRLPMVAHDTEEVKSLKNPAPATESSIKRGRVQFAIYCSICHGERGKGNGQVVKKGFLPPPDLTSDDIQNKKTDGQIYYTITYGGRYAMPHYRESIDPVDRWHIVNYIKHALTSEPRN